MNFIISFVSSVSILLPLIAGILKYKRFDDYFIKPFLVFMILSTVVEGINVYAATITQSNQLLFNLYPIFYVIFILVTYKQEITKPFFITGFITIIPLLVSLGLSPNTEDNVFIFTVSFTELILFSIFILYKIYKKDLSNIFSEPLFWIAFGTLIYCSCTLIVFSLSKYMINKTHPVLVSYYVFYLSAINITTNIFYARAFLCLRSKEKY